MRCFPLSSPHHLFVLLIITDDKRSIDHLNEVTIECCNNERVRMMYVACQVASIDLKIDYAIIETMQIYRQLLGTTAGLSFVPGAATSNKTAAAVSIFQAVVRCFGLPTVGWSIVYQIVKNMVWDELGRIVGIILAESVAVVGVLGTVVTGGMPVFLGTTAVTLPLVVPATTRLMLMVACDVILILTRAFRSTTLTGVGQPLQHDVEMAARAYRSMCSKVHKEVMAVIRKRDVIKAFKYHDVQAEFAGLVHKFKEEVLADVQKSALAKDLEGERRSTDSRMSSLLSIEKSVQKEIEEDQDDLNSARQALKEAPPRYEESPM